jgi:hypothetical protein
VKLLQAWTKKGDTLLLPKSYKERTKQSPRAPIHGQTLLLILVGLRLTGRAILNWKTQVSSGGTPRKGIRHLAQLRCQSGQDPFLTLLRNIHLPHLMNSYEI